jgi:hypothetical protein
VNAAIPTPAPKAAPVPWSLSGSVISGYAATLAARRLLEQIKPRLSPATRMLVEHPPLGIFFVPGTALDELLTELHAITNDELVRQVAHDTCRSSFGVILRPLLQSYLQLLGKSPESIFANLGAVTTILVRDLDFAYAPAGRNAGTLTLTFPTRTPVATFVAWEGIARFICKLARCAPEIRGHDALRGGCQVVIPIRWVAP